MRTWEAIRQAGYTSSYRHCPSCDGPMAKHASYCQACSPLIMRGENHVAWKGDAALGTTKRTRVQNFPIPDGQACELCTSLATDRHHVDSDPGNNAPDNLQFLCRRCHMRVDGRLEKFVETARKNSVPKPPKPCGECGRLAKPLSRGRCHTCYERARRRVKAMAARSRVDTEEARTEAPAQTADAGGETP